MRGEAAGGRLAFVKAAHGHSLPPGGGCSSYSRRRMVDGQIVDRGLAWRVVHRRWCVQPQVAGVAGPQWLRTAFPPPGLSHFNSILRLRDRSRRVFCRVSHRVIGNPFPRTH